MWIRNTANSGCCTTRSNQNIYNYAIDIDMREIKEIQAEIDKLNQQQDVISKKRYELYREIREVEKLELKNLENKYIHCMTDYGDTVMCVFKQMLFGNKVEITGPRVIYSNAPYGDDVRDRQVRVYCDYTSVSYDIDDFKEKTTGEHPVIEEITLDEYNEYLEQFASEIRYSGSPTAYIQTSTTICN